MHKSQILVHIKLCFKPKLQKMYLQISVTLRYVYYMYLLPFTLITFLIILQDAHSSDREGGDDESHIRHCGDTPPYTSIALIFGASVLNEDVEGEDVEGMEEEEGDDDVLNFEYEFDDDDDEGADYDLSWRKFIRLIITGIDTALP